MVLQGGPVIRILQRSAVRAVGLPHIALELVAKLPAAVLVIGVVAVIHPVGPVDRAIVQLHIVHALDTVLPEVVEGGIGVHDGDELESHLGIVGVGGDAGVEEGHVGGGVAALNLILEVQVVHALAVLGVGLGEVAGLDGGGVGEGVARLDHGGVALGVGGGILEDVALIHPVGQTGDGLLIGLGLELVDDGGGVAVGFPVEDAELIGQLVEEGEAAHRAAAAQVQGDHVGIGRLDGLEDLLRYGPVVDGAVIGILAVGQAVLLGDAQLVTDVRAHAQTAQFDAFLVGREAKENAVHAADFGVGFAAQGLNDLRAVVRGQIRTHIDDTVHGDPAGGVGVIHGDDIQLVTAGDHQLDGLLIAGEVQRQEVHLDVVVGDHVLVDGVIHGLGRGGVLRIELNPCEGQLIGLVSGVGALAGGGGVAVGDCAGTGAAAAGRAAGAGGIGASAAGQQSDDHQADEGDAKELFHFLTS